MMKRMPTGSRGWFSLLSMVAIAVVLSACTSSTVSETTPPATPDPARLSQTLWSVSDTPGVVGKPLADDDSDVDAIRTVVESLSNVMSSRSAATISQDLKDEEAFYSPTAFATLGTDYEAKVAGFYAENDLELAPVTLSWYPSTVSVDRTSAAVSIGSTFVFVSASDAFLADSKLAVDVPYLEMRHITLSKVDGKWLVDVVGREAITPDGMPK